MSLKEMNPKEEPAAGKRQLYIPYFALLTRPFVRPFATMKISSFATYHEYRL